MIKNILILYLHLKLTSNYNFYSLKNRKLKSRQFFIILFSLVVMSHCIAAIDQQKIDSLKKEISLSIQDSILLDLNLNLAKEWEKNNIDTALFYNNEALHIADKNHWLSKKAKVLINIGFAYYNNKNADKLFEYLLKGLKTYEKAGDKLGEMNTHYNLGCFYNTFEKIPEAIIQFKKAIEIAIEINHNTRLSGAYNNIGLMYNYSGLFDKANEYQFKALELVEKIGENTAYIHMNIALNYVQEKNYRKSYEHNKKSIALFQELDIIPYVAQGYKAIGDNYSDMSLIDSAEYFYNKAFEIFTELDDQNSIARHHMVIGIINQKRGLHKKGEAKYNLALKTIPKGENQKLRFAIYSNLCELYLMWTDSSVGSKTNLLHKTINYATEMFETAQYFEALDMQTKALKYLYKANYKLGNKITALNYADKYIVMKDSLITEQKQKAIAEMQTKYETEKKEQQIEIQQNKLENQQLSLKQERLIRDFFIGGFTLILILTIVILRNLIQKRKANQLLTQQKEEIATQSKKLHVTNESLKELSSFKEDMTNMMVHDLKNPISSILNIELIKDIDKRNQIVKYSGYRMMNLVQNILDVYKYKSVGMELNYTAFDLLQLVNSATDELSFAAKQKQLEFVINTNDKIVLKADAEILRRTMVNILSNAIKFAPNSSTININLIMANSSELKFTIHNNGPYIPANKQKQIFEKFGQAEKRGQGKINSTGLGLNFCQLAVEAHKGLIGVDSDKKEGTTFWFTLPKANVAETLSSHEIENAKNRNVISLSAAEKEGLQQVIPILTKLTVNELTAFRKVFAIIEDQNLGNKQWNAALQDTIYNCNETQFNYLVSLIRE